MGTRHREGKAPAVEAPADGVVGNMYVEDDLYDLINVDQISQQIVKTPEFERLQNIKHLGVAYMVHPDATHSAYEHSLGAYWLANNAITRLKKNQGLELGIEDFDVQTVKLAGLLHDVGRGPFGQIFEDFFCPPKWSREEMSLKIIDYIVDHHHIDIDDEVVKKAKDLLAFEKSAPMAKKRYLYDIVANRCNSIDVCTVDSVMRDMRACGLRRSFDFSRGFDIRVIDDETCYFDEHYTKIHDLFLSRADLHRMVYTHSDIKAIELMVADALVKANDTLKFTLDIENPAAYLKLDDKILDSIENSSEQGLKESQVLIRRIRNKDLYQLCSEFAVPEDKLDHFKDVTPKDVFCCLQKTSGISLSEEDIRVSNIHLDLACGKNNPFESISFHHNKPSKSRIDLIPDNYTSYQAKTVRVYTITNQPKQAKAICDGFATFLSRNYGVLPRPINIEENLTASFGDWCPCLKRLCRLMVHLNEARDHAASDEDIQMHIKQLPQLTRHSPEPEAPRVNQSPFQKVESIEDLKCVKLLMKQGCYPYHMQCYAEKENPKLMDMQLYSQRNDIDLKLINIKEWTEKDYERVQALEEDLVAGRTPRYLEYHINL